mgnify:CR=1 FL=1
MAQVLLEAQACVEKRKAKNACQTFIIEDPDIKGLLSVSAIYDLSSGTVTGKHIRDRYNNFRDGFGKHVYDKVWDLVGDTIDAEQDELEGILEEDFDGTECQLQGAPEGCYEFTLEDNLNCEVTNYGDKLVFGMYWEFPEDVTAD